MNLNDLLKRQVPQPWTEGDNIPWNEPGFSRRMLAIHLSQEHDAASRRTETIDQHVRFLHETAASGQPGKVLDLGCGPGLYLQRLAALGHTCRGIDFSPASIEYARRSAAEAGLPIDTILSDLRSAEYGTGYDLAMLIYGEFNVFRPDDARAILGKARDALKVGGRLVLEPSPEEHVRGLGGQPSSWYSSDGGLFSDRPHLVLEESFWDESSRAATTRYFVIEATSGDITRHAASYQAYSDADLRGLLGETGFDEIQFFPNLTGQGQRAADFITVLATRR